MHASDVCLRDAPHLCYIRELVSFGAARDGKEHNLHPTVDQCLVYPAKSDEGQNHGKLECHSCGSHVSPLEHEVSPATYGRGRFLFSCLPRRMHFDTTFEYMVTLYIYVYRQFLYLFLPLYILSTISTFFRIKHNVG
jgi:hypothetical protein